MHFTVYPIIIYVSENNILTKISNNIAKKKEIYY
jgi:hypothetical protein